MSSSRRNDQQAALNPQFAHVTMLLADVTSASLSPDAHRQIPGPALRLPSPTGGPSYQVQFQSLVYLIFYYGLIGRVAESQMANTALSCAKLSLGQI